MESTKESKQVLSGVIDSWTPRKFGFIVLKQPDGLLEKFFLLYRNIRLCEPDLPYPDCRVSFEVSTTEPNPGKFKLALNAEVRHPRVPTSGIAELAGEGGVK
ncbi:MAG: hypothetical protein ACRD4Y_16595 [Candidatus Acidiferrales bacterium]